MSGFHERAEAQTKQIIGQMLGDELSGAGRQEAAPMKRPSPSCPTVAMTRASCATSADRSNPADKERAQRVSRVDRGGDPPGKKI